MKNWILIIILSLFGINHLNAQSDIKSIIYNQRGDKLTISLDSLAKLNYNNKNYLYYLEKASKAQNTEKVGMYITSIGVGLIAFGAVLLIADPKNSNTHSSVVSLTVLGGIITNIGAPIWIIGHSYNKNNKYAMAQCKKNALSLNVNINNNGLGLVLRF